MEEEVKKIINKILERKKKEPLKELNYDLSLRNDLDMDSLDLAELTVRIEDAFGIDVFEDGIIDTIGEIMDKINKR
ncbi:acyl carrier protein [Pseudothermotoga elfii]|jgi:acyl carrier protein|uniref:acyl carrier protein n=1 Tax=Pseudothermotoga elfii TaxID=38322 RepID=UPI0003F56373|nr:phosphopantetheine-binding protein [Pseudothermotoga elfii]